MASDVEEIVSTGEICVQCQSKNPKEPPERRYQKDRGVKETVDILQLKGNHYLLTTIMYGQS